MKHFIVDFPQFSILAIHATDDANVRIKHKHTVQLYMYSTWVANSSLCLRQVCDREALCLLIYNIYRDHDVWNVRRLGPIREGQRYVKELRACNRYHAVHPCTEFLL